MEALRFKHFTLDEKEIAEKFIKKHQQFFNWRFDVRLKSKKSELVEIEDETLRLMWENLTAKRIDMLFEDARYIYIAEVKRVMLASGIGQLLLYERMYKEQFRPSKPVKLYYIVKYPDPDVDQFCKDLNILTWWPSET